MVQQVQHQLLKRIFFGSGAEFFSLSKLENEESLSPSALYSIVHRIVYILVIYACIVYIVLVTEFSSFGVGDDVFEIQIASNVSELYSSSLTPKMSRLNKHGESS